MAFDINHAKPGDGRGAPKGNKNGVKNKPFWDMITRIIAQEDGKRLREAGEKLFDAAAAGEEWAVKILADRLDGKPHQSVDLSNADGSALFAKIERVIIKNDKP